MGNVTSPSIINAMGDVTLTPYHSHRFCVVWKIKGTKTIYAEAGATSQLVYQWPGYDLDQDMIDSLASVNNILRGDRALLLKVVGEPVLGTTQATTAAPKVAIITNLKYEWTPKYSHVPSYTSADNLIKTGADTTINPTTDVSMTVLP